MANLVIKDGSSLESKYNILPIAIILVAAVFSGLASSVLPYWFFLIVFIFFSMIALGVFRPVWGAYFLLILASGLIPEQFTPNLPLFGGTVKAADIFLLLLIVLSYTRYLISGNNIDWGSDLLKPLYFVGLLIVFSLITGGLFFKNPVKYIAYEFRVYTYWLFALVLAYELKNQQIIKNTMHFIVGMSFVLAIVVIVQSATGWHLLSSARVESLDSAGVVTSGVSRSTFGGYQNFVVFSIVYLMAKLSRGEIRAYIAFPVLLIMIAGIVVTFGRGVWAAAFLSIVVMSVWLGWNSVLRIGLASLISGVLLLVCVQVAKPALIEAVIDRVSSVERELNKGESWRWRQAENDYALEKIEKYPITGIGLGGEYQPIRNRFMSPEQTRMMHNSYLYMVLKLGVFGILFPIWLCFAIWRESRKLVNIKKTTIDKTLVVAIGASLILPVFSGVTQPEWMEHKGVLYMATLLGMLYAIAHEKISVNRSVL